VREALKARFDTFLVDEFQDTDPLQARSFSIWPKRWRAGKKMGRGGVGRGPLVCGGDPKQSIYRFRGADIAAFELFSSGCWFRRGRRTLDANFRSEAPLLDFVNRVFQQT